MCGVLGFWGSLVKLHLVYTAKHRAIFLRYRVALKHSHILILRNVASLGAAVAFGKTKIDEAHFGIVCVLVSRGLVCVYHYIAWFQIVICQGSPMYFLNYLKQLLHYVQNELWTHVLLHIGLKVLLVPCHDEVMISLIIFLFVRPPDQGLEHI